jgi:hypothetical protein
MVSGFEQARRYPARSSSLPSTKWSASAWSKSQQMRWTPRGAHLLLQVRTRVLNNDLANDFQRWYPAFVTPSPSNTAAVAA